MRREELSCQQALLVHLLFHLLVYLTTTYNTISKIGEMNGTDKCEWCECSLAMEDYR